MLPQDAIHATATGPARIEARRSSLWEQVLRFFDEARICAEYKYGAPIEATARRKAYPQISAADWCRIQNHHMLRRLMAHQGVRDIEELADLARTHLEFHVAAHVLDDAAFEARMAKGSPFADVDYGATRAHWRSALAAPLPPVCRGETAIQALSYLHWHVGPVAAYGTGAAQLSEAQLRPGGDFWPVIAHAIARFRGLNANASPDSAPLEPPAYRDLTGGECDAVIHLHAALSMGTGLDTMLSDLMSEACTEKEVQTARALRSAVLRFQSEAAVLLTTQAVPHPLPWGPAADKPIATLSMCDAALMVVVLSTELAS